MPQHLRVENGLLSWKGRDLRLNFQAHVDRFGAITIEFDPISSSNDDLWRDHWSLWREPFFSLSGLTENKVSVHTDYARLEGLSETFTPHEIRLHPRGSASELNLAYYVSDEALPSQEISVTYLSRGQLGFPHEPIETPLGEMSASATSKIQESVDQFGTIIINKRNELGLEEWLQACDAMVERALNILSLGQGKWLQWSARHIMAGGELLASRIRPREIRVAALAHLFHHLNLRPILELAVQSYLQDPTAKTGIDVALSWMLAPAAYVEGTFLNQLIALEHLISCFEHNIRGLIPRTTFKKVVQPRLQQTIEELVESEQLTRNHGNIIASRIKGLNHPIFYDKIWQLIDYYRVPVADLETELRFAIVQCRNDLVHRGLLERIGEDSDRILRSGDIAEEFLKRVAMAILGYQGQYISSLYNLDTYIFREDGVEPLSQR
jgi:hypothetical protein